jgi:hypothetical protein
MCSIDPQQLLADDCDLVDRVEPERHLQAEALALACHLNHPVYDCIYLALAKREAATLISTDRRLRNLAGRVLPGAWAKHAPARMPPLLTGGSSSRP